MTLASEMRKLQDEMAGKMPGDLAHLLADKMEDLVKSGIAESALHKGHEMPTFSLPNVFGKNAENSMRSSVPAA